MNAIRFISILLIIIPCLSLGQDEIVEERTQDTGDPVYQQEVSVSLQLVDVRVMDGTGNYMRGLTKEDFIVRINGKVLPVRTFDVYSSTYQPSVSDMATGMVTEPVSSPGRTLIVFFDHPFSDMRMMKQAKQGVRNFLMNSVRTNDSIMLAGYERSFKVYSPLTKDFNKTLYALERIQHRNDNDSGFVDIQTVPQVSESDGNPGGTVPEEESTGNPYRDLQNMADNEREYYIRTYLDSLESFAEYLRTIPGRKTMVLVSGGYDQFFTMRRNLNVRQRQVYQKFNDSNTSIYTIDVTRFDSEHRLGQSGTGRIMSAAEANAQLRREVFDVGNYDLSLARRQSLQAFANSTGGEFYFAGNDMSNLFTKLHLDTSNYYVLGFYTRDIPDGDYNSIEVEVDRPNAEVIHRQGYYSPKGVAEMTVDERLVHLERGFNRTRPLKEFPADFGLYMFPRSDGDIISGVTFEIPLQSGQAYEFELVGHVKQPESGEIIDSFHQKYSFTAEDQNTFYHFQPLSIGEGENIIQVGARNNLTSERSYHFFRALPRNLESPLRVSSICIVEPSAVSAVNTSSLAAKPLEKVLYDSSLIRRPADPFEPIHDKKGMRIVEMDAPVMGDFIMVSVKIAITDEEYTQSDLGCGFLLQGLDGVTRPLNSNKTEYFVSPDSREVFVYSILDVSEIPAGEYSMIALVSSALDSSSITNQRKLTLQ